MRRDATDLQAPTAAISNQAESQEDFLEQSVESQASVGEIWKKKKRIDPMWNLIDLLSQ